MVAGSLLGLDAPLYMQQVPSNAQTFLTVNNTHKIWRGNLFKVKHLSIICLFWGCLPPSPWPEIISSIVTRPYNALLAI